jgi:hypothetical protein
MSAGGAAEPDLPLAGYAELAAGLRRDGWSLGLVAGGETGRALPALSATLGTGTFALRVGWTGGTRFAPTVALDGGLSWRRLDGKEADPDAVFPYVAADLVAGYRAGAVVVGPCLRVSADLAPVVVRVGGEPWRELSPIGIDGGLALTLAL